MFGGTPATTYQYDAAGRMEQTDLFNGSVTNYTLDKADRLTGIQHSADGQILADYQYTLDNNGNRIKAVVEEPIKPEALINRSQGYTYKAQMNRLLATQLNGTDQATFNYDHEGRLFRIFPHGERPTSFTFDHAHRLIRHGNEQYVYDGTGNRIQVTRNGQVTKYIFDAAGNLLAEANNSNQITRYYIYGQGLLGFVDASTNQLYTYHFDGTGHTVAITNQNREIVNTYAYDPYGRLMGQSETIAQPFKYAGQFGVQAEADNLYYMRARYYDADIGRFISEDPIGFEGGLNLYAYAGGNPVMFVDPSGLVGNDINNRPGPIDQSGRQPRVGSPLEGPFKTPNTLEDNIGNKILDNILKQITGIGGLASRSPLAIGIPLITHSKNLGGCDDNGVCSDMNPKVLNSQSSVIHSGK